MVAEAARPGEVAAEFQRRILDDERARQAASAAAHADDERVARELAAKLQAEEPEASAPAALGAGAQMQMREDEAAAAALAAQLDEEDEAARREADDAAAAVALAAQEEEDAERARRRREAEDERFARRLHAEERGQRVATPRLGGRAQGFIQSRQHNVSIERVRRRLRRELGPGRRVAPDERGVRRVSG